MNRRLHVIPESYKLRATLETLTHTHTHTHDCLQGAKCHTHTNTHTHSHTQALTHTLMCTHLLLPSGGYVSYLVTTRALAEAPGFSPGSQFGVRRRFSDFVALSSVLKVRAQLASVAKLLLLKTAVAAASVCLASAASGLRGLRDVVFVLLSCCVSFKAGCFRMIWTPAQLTSELIIWSSLLLWNVSCQRAFL